jgi:polysaccharide deacetylase family protein (PEP-CTERM system associated)
MSGGYGSLPGLCRAQAGSAPSKLDLEIFFTLDLEDHLGCYDESSRFIPVVYRILDLLDESGCRGTFFTVGRACIAAPAVIREITARGHEVACHSHEHRRLDEEDHCRFRDQTAAAKDRLEQTGGSAVTGFRAPFFSLIPSTVWALDILAELGFAYSSSVLPGHHPLYGFPDAPQHPFRWPNGLVELPCPIGRIGRFALPFLGGPYLRYLPALVVSRLLARYDGSTCLWTYCHPYDFDETEPYVRMPDVPAAANFLLWLNRRPMYRKMKALLRNGSRLSLAQFVSRPEFHSALPVFSAYGGGPTERDGSACHPPYRADVAPTRLAAGTRGHKSAGSTPA